MSRLLFISLCLWSLARAIPEQDLTLIKQVEQLTESTYKKIMKEVLDFNIYKAQLAIECKALDESETQRWQYWLDHLSKLSNIENVSQDEIQFTVERLAETYLVRGYRYYVAPDVLLDRLNQCTNGTYGDRLSKSDRSSEEILKALDNIAIDKLREVSEATKQTDSNMFDAFHSYVHAARGERESTFKDFRSKITSYEGKLIFIEVRTLDTEMKKPYMQSALKSTKYWLESTVSCRAANQTIINMFEFNIKYIEGLQSVSEISNYRTNLLRFISEDEELRLIDQRLDECTKGTARKMESELDLLKKEYVTDFQKLIIPKMESVSQDAKQSYKSVIEHYNDFKNAKDWAYMELYYDSFINMLNII